MNHELTVASAAAAVHLDADPARLAQVVGNLLNNACKFTDKGGHVWLTVEQEGEQAVVRVRDSGIGIAADQLPRLFEMFAQVDTSLERSRDGLGIGLTLVKTLVEMHGGTVDVHSDGLGRGSEFAVRLPILVEAPRPLSPADRQRADASGEPSRLDRRRQRGRGGIACPAVAVRRPRDARGTRRPRGDRSRRAVPPDVVLLDIGLPNLNGYEVCRRIREEPWGKDLVLWP